jgi:hypothetical protein
MNIIRVIKSRGMEWVRHVACSMGEMRNTYKILVRRLAGKRTLGIPGRRRENNIRVDLREIEWQGVDWMHLVQDRDLVNTVMNLLVQ